MSSQRQPSANEYQSLNYGREDFAASNLRCISACGTRETHHKDL